MHRDQVEISVRLISGDFNSQNLFVSFVLFCGSCLLVLRVLSCVSWSSALVFALSYSLLPTLYSLLTELS